MRRIAWGLTREAGAAPPSASSSALVVPTRRAADAGPAAPGPRPAGHAWPAPAAGSPASRVVVVARTDHSGLLAAQRVAREWASGQVAGLVDLVGLVLVADAPGRRPKELRQLEQLVAGGYPRAWTLPWIDAWRLGPAEPADMGREHQRLLADLQLTASPR